MLRTTLIALLLLALPATASAAPFGELPFQPAGGAAACLQPTGKPGEVVRWVRGGVQTMEARVDGLHATGGVPLGTYKACPSVAGDASGAAVIAAPLANAIRVAWREPGAATWSAPVTVPGVQTWQLAVAVSARGDLLVAWEEGDPADRVRARAVRRPAGGTLGAVEDVAPWRDDRDLDSALEVGMSGTGEAFVVFTEPVGSQSTRTVVRRATPGAGFGPRRALATTRHGAAPVLAVGPDGRALVAVGGFNELQLHERAPGGEFAPLQVLDVGSVSGTVALALGAGGDAVMAWRQGSYDPVNVVTRSAPGPFGVPLRAAPELPRVRSSDYGTLYLVTGINPPPDRQPELTAKLAPDGRALLAWPTPEHGVGMVSVSGGVASDHALLGNPIRDPSGLAPLVLADGTRALAWSDDRGLHDPVRAGDGRLHLAVEGVAPAPAPAPAPPRVTVGKPERRALRPAQALVLPVRCSAACDLRVVVPGAPPETDATGSRADAGVVRLRIAPNLGDPLVPRSGRLRLRLRSSAPGGREVQQWSVTLKLRRLPAPRLPRILDARVRRDGDDVVVRWRTDGPVRDAYFLVYGQRGPGLRSEVVATGGPRRLTGRAFSVRLRDAAKARYVRIALSPLGGSRGGRQVRLKVPLI